MCKAALRGGSSRKMEVRVSEYRVWKFFLAMDIQLVHLGKATKRTF
jgi:hypothetical protein